ncbi:hypothetical protein GCM10010326_30530 [Streptomyces xanthochromogenes]|uniref:Uncharacterized protein n=1 Tax=Streptomyces xanthochromogenes TaxID=67384 RepID=A0ABQ3A6Z0_9ACTN|nr:hypothetical protein GCM10010326_30530 [Streptomyces xanthochromogenes]
MIMLISSRMTTAPSTRRTRKRNMEWLFRRYAVPPARSGPGEPSRRYYCFTKIEFGLIVP